MTRVQSYPMRVFLKLRFLVFPLLQSLGPRRRLKLKEKVERRGNAVFVVSMMPSRSVVAVERLNTVDKLAKRSTGRNTNGSAIPRMKLVPWMKPVPKMKPVPRMKPIHRMRPIIAFKLRIFPLFRTLIWASAKDARRSSLH